ncbi:amidohydrolase family protein [soil metagenome]
MIIRARVVVTMAGAPVEDGACVIRGNRIIAAGKWPAIRARHTGPIQDLGESVLLPGLINAHCHLDYTCLRGAIPPPESFTAWIRAINARKVELTPEDYLASIADGFQEAVQFGTTSLANLEAFPGLLPRLLPPPLRTWWFAEMIDVRGPVAAAEKVEQLRAAGDFGLAPHAPFTASASLYREAAAVAERENVPLTTHLAESREELQMFRDGAGPLFDFMRDIGRPMEDCGGTTPLAFLAKEQVQLSERWIVAHLNELTAGDFAWLEELGSRFHIVHCPRSHAFFGHGPFALAQLRALRFNICLGTDSLASNSSLSLFAEMREARRSFPFLDARELLEMVTIHPAAALRVGKRLGRLAENCFADMIALPFTGRCSEVYEAIVDYAEEVPWILVNGKVPLGSS